MKKISKTTIQEIINLYQIGISPKEIGEKFGIYNNSVTRILRKNGIDRNQSAPKVDDESIRLIIDRYSKNETAESIAKDLKIDSSTVCRILKRNNIKIRKVAGNKKYDINENFFESIDSEEQAYFLGMLYADGSVGTNSNAIILSLKDIDEDIVKKLSTFIYGKVQVSFYENKNKCRVCNLSIYSKKMKTDLEKLGCINNKTFSIRLPQLKDELYPHFIRGYFDGDGCISTKNGNRVDITSNYSFINDLVTYLRNKLNISIREGNEFPTNCLQIKHQESLIKFYNYLYKDATLFMNRKYVHYSECLGININNKTNKKINKINKSLFFDGIRLTSENYKFLNKDEVVKSLLNFFKENGFPFPKYTNQELINDFSSLKSLPLDNIINSNNEINLNNKLGNKIFKHFNEHFYSAKSGIRDMYSYVEAFNDDAVLENVIKNRIDGNFNLTTDMIIQGLRNTYSCFSASIFYATTAKVVYEKFCKENDTVLDFSMGFGQRLLGAMSCSKNIKYIGVDPLYKNISSAQNIVNFLNQYDGSIPDRVELLNIGSENIKLENCIDLAFSSPPYFNKEIYSDEPTQCYNNKTYFNFLDDWWRKTVANVCKALKVNGIFALNIENGDLSKDMINVCKTNGLIVVDELRIRLNRNNSFRKQAYKYEPIFILRKQ